MSVTLVEPNPQSPSFRKNLLDESHEKILSSEGKYGVSNLCVLYVTAFLFGGFVVAELIGALAGNSLSLLGDAAAMAVDVFTYFSNMYAERVKIKQGYLDTRTRFILEVYIPSFSVIALLGVTGYIMSDAITVIRNKGYDGGDEVNIVFLYAFSCGNFAVDVFSTIMFYLRGSDGFKNYHEVTLKHPEISSLENGDHDHGSSPALRNISLDGRTDRVILETTGISINSHHNHKNPNNNNKALLSDTSAHGINDQGSNDNNNGSSNSNSSVNNNSDNNGTNNSTKKKLIRNNLNMLSAFTHVGSDTLRTISVFIAAVIATTTGIEGNLCDAWASIVVSLTIVCAVIPLCREIYFAANHPLDDDGRDVHHHDNARRSRSNSSNVSNPMNSVL